MKKNDARSAKKGSGFNYLDYIPAHGTLHGFGISPDGEVTIFIENKGVFNRIAQKLFHKPPVTQVHLDIMGNFIWPLIDGTRTIYDISLLVHEHFGEAAEPLYDRLVTYMNTLKVNGFITFVNDSK
jgi:hypothetical protein